MSPQPLSDDERNELASAHPEWSINGPAMSRTFELADFGEAMGFVTRVGLAAERLDHHPDIDIRWNKVRLELSTHSVGALTELDQKLVGIIDRMV